MWHLLSRRRILRAAEQGDAEEVSRLLRANFLLATIHDREGRSPLHLAALAGHSDTIAILLSHGAEVNARARHGQTPLHWAAWRGHLDAVALLLSHGAECNARTTDGKTPLWAAVFGGHIDVVKLLLSKGANANAADSSGTTPLWIAVLGGSSGGIKYLASSNVDVLKQGIRLVPAVRVTTLLRVDKEVEAAKIAVTTPDVSTPAQMVECLLSNGAEVTKAGHSHGLMPLHIAVARGDADVANLLLSNGADANAPGPDGMTALDLAYEMPTMPGMRAVSYFLRRYGAIKSSQRS